MTSSRLYIARALYEWILDNNCTPYILVDAGRPGAAVPMEYVRDGQIVLNISPTAVRALMIGDDAITFDGRFSGESLTITVPMDALMAIYASENGQGMVFEPAGEALDDGDDATENTPLFEAVESDETPTPPKSPSKSKRPSLKVVK